MTATGIARSSSNSSKTNDRLQERLARAVAAKNAGHKSDSHSLSVTPNRSGVSTPARNNDSPRQSLDASSAAGTEGEEEVATQPSSKDNGDIQTAGKAEKLDGEGKLGHLPPKIEQFETPPRHSTESARSSIARISIDSAIHQTPAPGLSTDGPSAEATTTSPPQKSAAEYDTLLKQLQSDFETSELQRQEEVHSYVERIDALEAKLQYLARESAESARATIISAPAGSLEKKLADKEEQVALLMEEGQKLSKKELSHLTTIKKLRVTIQEHNKELAESKKKQEKAERDALAANDRLKRAVGSERLLTDKQRLILQLQKEVDSLKATRDANDSTIADLKGQLDEAIAQSRQTEIKIANEALEIEKTRVADLEEDIANLKIENNLIADRAQALVKELREKMDKDAERARMTQLEMKTEQQMLESKLEVMRARAEEVSSGATGDAQAKLLRQIETLQTQYAVAGENWQGIEASLISRATSLEKERDEATRKEADVRRKARDVVSHVAVLDEVLH
jgi:DNA repair exonuclease SbcCD ATPase subunit